MRHSKRSVEGYYSIDDRVSGGKLREYAVATCTHCHRQIVSPRTRAKLECPRCDQYICVACSLEYGMTLECRNFNRHLDQVERAAYRELTRHITVDPRIITP